MTENSILFLIGTLLTICQLLVTAVLGWIAFELRHMRCALESRVKQEYCDKAMDGHCGEIRNLWGITREQGERLARLEK